MLRALPYGDGATVALIPQDLTSSAKSSNWASVVDIKSRLNAVILIGAGTATQNITITVNQAKDAAGTGSKLLKLKEIYYKAGASGAILAATDKWIKSSNASRESPADSYVTTVDRVAATNHFMALLKICPSDLDLANGFKFVGFSFNAPAASQIACGIWLPEGAAYHGDPASLLG